MTHNSKLFRLRRKRALMPGLMAPDALESRAVLSVTLPALPAGAQYQLAFVTSERTATTSSEIAFYNNIVARNAADNPSLPTTTWKAWASTTSVHARFNAPTYVDIPVYNLKGELVAQGSQEFLHPVHRAAIAYDQFGFYANTTVATGSSYNGYSAGKSSLGNFLGNVGLSTSATSPRNWSNQSFDYMSTSRGLYGLSGLITVPDIGLAPPQVTGVSATVSQSGVQLQWQPAVSYGAGAPSDYVVRLSADAGQTWTTYDDGVSTETATFVTGLVPNTTYIIEVAAINGSGAGPYGRSGAVFLGGLSTVPTPPESVAVTSVFNTFIVEWEPPASDGGLPVTSYTLSYSKDYGKSWTTMPARENADSFALISGLEVGSQYRFRVAAENAQGLGGYSRPSVDVRSTTPRPNVPRGSSYQLIFVTSEERSAHSQDIAVYDGIVTRNAQDNTSLAGIGWKAWASTPTVNARDHATVHGPVYNLAGQMVAANASQFLYPTHAVSVLYDQFGLIQREWVATGSSYNGYSAGSSSLGNFLGNLGRSDGSTVPNEWVNIEANYLDYARAFYGLSSVIVSDGGNAAPTAINISGGELTANVEAGELVGRLSAADPDETDTHSYRLVRGAGDTHNSLFAILGDELRVGAAAALPVETGVLTVRVRAKDQRGFPVESVLSIVLRESGITVDEGHTAVDPAIRTGDYRLVKQGLGRLILDQANTHIGGTVVESGELVVRNTAALGAGGLEVRPGAKVVLEVGYDAVNLGNLALDATGRLELGTGRVTIPAGGYDLVALRQLLSVGRNGGTWDGPAGVTSRAAGAGTKRAIGYIVSAGTLTLGWAAYGDLNLDGRVNSTDLSLLTGSGRFNRPGSDSVWAQGDFNYDGRVNSTDISLLTGAALFNKPSYRTGSGTVADASSSASLLQAAAWYVIGAEHFGTEDTRVKARV